MNTKCFRDRPWLFVFFIILFILIVLFISLLWRNPLSFFISTKIMPHFGIKEFALFDYQCKRGGCSGEICTSDLGWRSINTICIWKPEYVCLKDCKVRHFSCSFDEEFKAKCISCVKACKDSYLTQLNKNEQAFKDCINSCRKMGK